MNRISRVSLPSKSWVKAQPQKFDAEQREELWDIFHDTYSPIGLPHQSVESLLQDSKYFWISDMDDDETLDAFIAYKETPAGNKIQLSGAKRFARRKLIEKKLELLRKNGWYVESSHRPAEILEASGIFPIDNEEIVRSVLKKDIEWLGDGKYSRVITGVGRVIKSLYGNPKITQRTASQFWYHGTTKQFDAFDTYEGNTFGTGRSEVPLFFSPSERFAKLYANTKGGRVFKVKLKWNKIFDGEALYTRKGRYWPPSPEEMTKEGEILRDDLASGKIFPGVDEDDWDVFHDSQGLFSSILNNHYDVIETTEFKRWLKKNNYDAAYVTGDGEKNVFVFRPEQVQIVDVYSTDEASALREATASLIAEVNRVRRFA